MRSFKKIAAMIMAVAMLCSFTALGASVSIGDIVVSDENVATIPYTVTDPALDTEVTALVYTGESLEGADIVHIDQFANGAPALNIDVEYGEYTVVMGGTGMSTGDTKTFEGKNIVKEWTVTTSATNGYIKSDKDLTAKIADGETINLEFAPYLGYELDSLTINGEEIVNNIAANNGVYSYAYVAKENATIVATFTQVVVDAAEGGVQTSADIYDIEGVDNDDNKANDSSKITFAKLAEADGKTIVEYGMKVEVKVDGEWADYKTPISKMGPYFKATNGNVGGAYGIRFFGFVAGEYKVTSYVIYEDAEGAKTEKTGAPVVFTVG